MLGLVAAMAMVNPQPGLDLLREIDSAFVLEGSGLAAEAWPDRSMPAFNWSVGVYLSALNAAAEVEPESWKPRLRAYVDAAGSYWNATPPVPGYDVLPGPKPKDRYYDDNAWMVMALLESAEALNDPVLVARAADTLTFVLSGEDDVLGGGLWWHEDRRESKHTCSTSPGASAALALHAVRPSDPLVETAERLHAWVLAKLQDPADGLMWDCVRVDGSVDKTKWSYNTALTLRTALDLWKATGRACYREQADRLAQASLARWYDPSSGAIRDEGRFAHLMLEAWLRYEDATGLDLVDGAKVSAWLVQLRGGRPWYGKRFDESAPADQTRFELIDQASVARALLVAR